jgi:hypothetical protein
MVFLMYSIEWLASNTQHLLKRYGVVKEEQLTYNRSAVLSALPCIRYN